MFERVLSKETRKDLETLAGSGILRNFYLAGGTAVALYLGHRISLDLDFFSEQSFDNKVMIGQLKSLGKLKIEKESWGTIWSIFNTTKLSLFSYDYPLLNKLTAYKRVKLASLLDIACMKISAISSRGTKRDFIDLYMICKEGISLKKVMNGFRDKYKDVDYNSLHILKSLTYFTDAEKEPMPEMLVEVSWSKVKDFFELETKSHS